jgi:hypothetical protein
MLEPPILKERWMSRLPLRTSADAPDEIEHAMPVDEHLVNVEAAAAMGNGQSIDQKFPPITGDLAVIESGRP